MFAGALLRRTLPAIGAAAGVLWLVYVLGEAYRFGFDLWPTTTLTGMKAMNLSESDYQSGIGMILNSGERVNETACFGSELRAELERCLDANGAREFFAEIHSGSHFWPTQLVETGIMLAAAGALVRPPSGWCAAVHPDGGQGPSGRLFGHISATTRR
ncbi:hypothetical protein GCM10012287_23940 [Streptomyces daqingensis]|uniref:Uncharacterized protein n=1 Tax=Streptomyces daqingensis TaxID=1472640 RepID=A0ABQ2MA86_9ACTN|nr:hypothetical protein [Streptomyces daqingensis]GGO48597.1 hypothetical protein GCM10012287_23940 [Streptomyces daqingensis]